MKKYFLLSFLMIFIKLSAQENLSSVMTLGEYLGTVKAYHPIVKQANLVINNSEAKLLKARGAFDPKIEVDFDKKVFKDSEYYNKLNGAFKIPTWYGIELKANFENNEGSYLNPEATVPTDGLYAAGISGSLLRNFVINERMASLKQAKLFINQAKEDQQILVNEILYKASLSYFDWLKTYNEKTTYEDFLENAQIRFDGTKKLFFKGDKPAIDTLEAGITLNDRKLNLEKARIKFIKASLELSNFLWLANNTPIELQENIIPDVNLLNTIDTTLNIALFNDDEFDINNHPKIKSLEFKIESLNVDKNLKMNNLLPKLDVQYNFLTQTPRSANSLIVDNFKAGINFSMPLFLRKERGDLKLARIKLQETQFENEVTKVSIKNEVSAVQQELTSFVQQTGFIDNIVSDYNKLLSAEERKFFMGESSLFIVNSRESKLIESQLKAIDIQNLFFKTKAKLFKAAVISITE
ncbi:MAG: TolC family protein [Flavobacteriia bacterium]|nr:TolC family protein [Flavobacteriia bacterium]PIV97061.1 MAG: transporter [Flavobacteriaceae bacterium CG17_big_fil_post_rev_8_21_14_2_50_31_13]PIX14508.1 MAG: transporter [Flavobacteriaceae bacterium CG_4_8_14_3_um_filter_31_8]PIY16363.1 MAG: transporter [Flavobacteriaceae bacterium CG_4_10_14_3_um_filter_31_253]PIZ12238.1 MAG: transporter [Flavobacteriaceae bacterium CG_4_10_14_0_8_um_filter_31_99]PJC11309.1 MAG: transporter [Flavobacteriaceae bacterium CG_4_9_14_0_8_um_filter_31_91]